MNIPFFRPDITEEEIQAVTEVLRSGWITTGPKTKELEGALADFCGTRRAACLSSQTAAAELTLRLLGIGQGDEVILPAYTYTATCSVVCHVGATPVLVDCAPDSYEMDYNQLERAVTHRTKCVIPVDLGGKMCDYRRIFQIVREKSSLFLAKNQLQEAFGRIVVLADSAHALGASREGLKCGQAADFTTFSFHAVKNLTTAEGGAVTWNPIPEVEDDWIYRQYMLFSLHGQDKDALAKNRAGSWEYDIVAPYYKCNMTDIQAALGLAQLRRYPAMLAKRQEMINRYNQALETMPVRPMLHQGKDWRSSGHLYLVELPGWKEKERNRLITAMSEKGVACNVHYKPLPLLTAYRRMGFQPQDYPNALRHYSQEITLPLSTSFTQMEIEYLLSAFMRCISGRYKK